MHQNLLNAECASEEYRNAGDKNMHVSGVMKAPTKESRRMPGSFCCTYACLSSGPIAFFGLNPSTRKGEVFPSPFFNGTNKLYFFYL
jgi:hypothetical protein